MIKFKKKNHTQAQSPSILLFALQLAIIAIEAKLNYFLQENINKSVHSNKTKKNMKLLHFSL